MCCEEKIELLSRRRRICPPLARYESDIKNKKKPENQAYVLRREGSNFCPARGGYESTESETSSELPKIKKAWKNRLKCYEEKERPPMARFESELRKGGYESADGEISSVLLKIKNPDYSGS